MDIDQYIEVIQREGERLASAAERTPLDTVIPTCPGWNVRDLLRHIRGIHTWAATIVREARPKPFDPFVEMEGNWPSDDALIDWFRQGHAALVQALEAAPADLDCFTFLPGTRSARQFWARRQAHETGMHRADVEGASGGFVTPFAVDQAQDGIDELLFGFMARPKQQLRSERPRTLAFHAMDTDANWLVRLTQDEPVVTREPTEQADCRVSASASDLFLLVWNRRAADGLDVSGDQSLLNLWRESVFVRWR